MNSKSSLCENCKAVDVALLLSEVRGKVELGSLLDIEQRKNCSFCDFIKRTIHQQHDEFLPAEFWADCKIKKQQLDCYLEDFVLESPELARGQRCGIFIKTKPELRFSELYRNFSGWDHPTFQLLANDRCSQDSYLKAREILPQIDWGLPLRWLQICEKIHPYTPRKINGIRLIDLENECLVSNPPCCRYFALSYVWGRNQQVTLKDSNLRELHEHRSLAVTTKGLSKTIQDAMILTRALKERYLWVDALCIVQDSKEDQRVQIQRMDEIYQNGVLTIVACHGSDAECGLPGVALESRYPKQVMAEVEGQNLVGYASDRWRSKRDSKWRTRCWTFQEEFLSNRLMIVTTNQLFFECKAHCEFCEEVVQEIETFTPAESDFFPRSLYTEEQDSFNAYAQTVSHFTSRELSKPDDYLNACSGILKSWGASFREFAFVGGLPETVMDAALLWRPVDACERRLDLHSQIPIFPSWSWAGWVGLVKYERITNACETIIPLLKWHVDLDRHEMLRKSMVKIQRDAHRDAYNVSNRWSRAVNNSSGQVWYIDRKANKSFRFSRPIIGRTVLEVLTALDPATDYLRFHARRAFFHLTAQHMKSRVADLPCDQERNGTCLLTVFDEAGIAAGAVLVGSKSTPHSMIGKQEFIALSRTTLTHDVDDPSWDPCTKEFVKSVPEGRAYIDNNHHAGKVKKYPENIRSTFTGSYTWHGLYELQKPYNPNKLWPFYNVLLIERENGIAYRQGIGKIHVDAFDPISEEQDITLG